MNDTFAKAIPRAANRYCPRDPQLPNLPDFNTKHGNNNEAHAHTHNEHNRNRSIGGKKVGGSVPRIQIGAAVIHLPSGVEKVESLLRFIVDNLLEESPAHLLC